MSYNQQQMFNAWNTQQQPVFQQQLNSNQPLNSASDFPSMQTGSAQAASDNPFASSGFNMASSDFNAGASEFVPQGVNAGKEEFPDLDEAFGSGGGKKSKKQQPTKAQIEKEKLEAQMALPTKGKPSEFFAH